MSMSMRIRTMMMMIVIVIVTMEKKVCWVMGLTVARVTASNGIQSYICYLTNSPLRYILFLSTRASTGLVTSEAKSITSPVTNTKKIVTLGGS